MSRQRLQKELKTKGVGAICGCMLLFSSLEAGSLRLLNDSIYTLKAVVVGADGSDLGMMMVKPNETGFWSSEQHSAEQGNQSVMENPSESLTPYTVHWYCPYGGVYGLCPGLATGALVTAKGSAGARTCHIPKGKDKKKGESNEEDTNAPSGEDSSANDGA